MIKFGIQNGLNVARAGYSEDQILTACMLADRTGYDSIFLHGPHKCSTMEKCNCT